MSGRKSRNKGYRGEKEFRDMCEELGFDVTWQAEDPKKPDVNINGFDTEVKFRSSVSKTVYEWLNEKGADILAMRRVEGRGKKNYEWLGVMRLKDLLELILKLKKEGSDSIEEES